MPYDFEDEFGFSLSTDSDSDYEEELDWVAEELEFTYDELVY